MPADVWASNLPAYRQPLQNIPGQGSVFDPNFGMYNMYGYLNSNNKIDPRTGNVMLQSGPNSWWGGMGNGQGWQTPLFSHNNNLSGPFGGSGFSSFDQFGQFGPGFQLGRGSGGIQTSVQGNPITQFGRPIQEDPIFADVLSQLYNPIYAPNVFGNGDPSMAGMGAFNQGINTLGLGKGGMSPELQGALDIINQLQGKATNSAASAAQALASRRGLAGSSVEQFGVGSAIGEASQPFVQQQGNILLSEASRQQQLRDLQARAYFDRGNLENQANLQRAQIEAQLAGQFGGYDLQRRSNIANLTSDEIASLRNLKEGGLNRSLQIELGNQGINQANWLASIMQSNQPSNSFFDSIAPGLFGGIGTGIGYGFMR